MFKHSIKGYTLYFFNSNSKSNRGIGCQHTIPATARLPLPGPSVGIYRSSHHDHPESSPSTNLYRGDAVWDRSATVSTSYIHPLLG